MPECGSQCWLCDLPIRFDTYSGCSHGCKYCFVQRNNKYDLKDIKKKETAKGLRAWIEGGRNKETNWCDWNIPLHWGGNSDPFQPAEKTLRASYECLKVFAETQYPFIVSTKGKLIADEEYLELLKQCNCVVQISVVCDKYDKLETGAPTFEERLEIIRKVSPNVKRVIVRIQPYMCEVFRDVYNNLAKFKEAGAYGIIVEGMKFATKKDGLVKVGGDWTYPQQTIERDIKRLKDRAHELGLKFYSGENRTRKMGDSLTCCGIDGLEGFTPNAFNINHLINGETVQPTDRMKETGTALCFQSLYQTTPETRRLKNSSFQHEMLRMLDTKKKSVYETFGKRNK